MKRKIKITLITIAVLLFLFLCGRLVMAIDWYNHYVPPKGERAETATDLPDCDQTVSDVRITSIPRTQKTFSFVLDGKEVAGNFIQIFYGYQVDGVWYDFPSENYPFYNITGKRTGNNDFNLVAVENHIVRIGDYVLVCILTDSEEYAPYDTLGTVPETPFLELERGKTEDSSYGVITEDRERILSWDEPAYCVNGHLGFRYYFILDINQLPEDYELHYFVNSASAKDTNYQAEKVLTREDIQEYVQKVAYGFET